VVTAALVFFCRESPQIAIKRTAELTKEDAEIIFIAISVLAFRISTRSKSWRGLNCFFSAARLAAICK
jgi:hypothetical protein